MVDLLEKFTLQDIVLMLVMFALAFKGCITFFDWCWKRIRKEVDKANKPNELEKDLEANTHEIEQLQNSLNEVTKMVLLLLESDKDDIKAFITREHHYFCYQKGWIDDYSLDCIERRYNHYKDQGGNSFIQNLMTEIRALPRYQSESNIKK